MCWWEQQCQAENFRTPLLMISKTIQALQISEMKKRICYQEDIYVGYRYFETFAPERVQFPFGFGLSYTDFSMEVKHAEILGSGVDVSVEFQVEVKNVGSQYAGKEVVQVYYEAPQGKLGKPARELGAFAKTEVLQPGETQVLTLQLPVATMASYDDSGVTGYKSCYVLEPGLYKFYVGGDVRAAQQVSLQGQEGMEISECMVTEVFWRKHWRLQRNFRDFALETKRRMEPMNQRQRMFQSRPFPWKKGFGSGCQRQWKSQETREFPSRIRDKKASLEAFVAQLSERELAILVRGEGMCDPLVTPGTASAFGGTAPSLYAMESLRYVLQTGLRYSYGQWIKSYTNAYWNHAGCQLESAACGGTL